MEKVEINKIFAEFLGYKQYTFNPTKNFVNPKDAPFEIYFYKGDYSEEELYNFAWECSNSPLRIFDFEHNMNHLMLVFEEIQNTLLPQYKIDVTFQAGELLPNKDKKRYFIQIKIYQFITKDNKFIEDIITASGYYKYVDSIQEAFYNVLPNFLETFIRIDSDLRKPKDI